VARRILSLDDDFSDATTRRAANAVINPPPPKGKPKP
jgi:hypothetical protein